MAENSKIEWTDHTANLWWGCTKVHEGCDHCYAETLSKRWGFDVWGNDKPRRIIKRTFADLDRFQKQAELEGVTKRVFVGSMMDIFEKPMSLVDNDGNYSSLTDTDSLRWDLFLYIDNGFYPNLEFQLLTKRPGNINKYIPPHWKSEPPPNVMFGCSVVNQATADKLIPQLLMVEGKRFLSVEPMLGPVNLRPFFDMPFPNCSIDWVIVGGESGPGRRPFDPNWARQIRDDCKEFGVPFFMKQWDKVIAIPEDLMIREFADASCLSMTKKKVKNDRNKD